MAFETENAAVARVYYDNDGLPGATLIVGAIAHDVPAGDHGAFSVVLGTCGTARQVLIGGQRLGELPSQPVAPEAPIGALVDIKGGRCYRRRPEVVVDDV